MRQAVRHHPAFVVVGSIGFLCAVVLVLLAKRADAAAPPVKIVHYTVTVKVSTDDVLPARWAADGELPGQALTARRGTLPPPPRMVLTVTDDGPGIAPELIPELFERFTRADTARSHADDAPSTGLGLAIVDAVVAAHHGTVAATSRPGLTRFTIVLPRLAEPAASTGRRPRPARKSLRSAAPGG